MASQMLVYASEREAGLEDQLLNNRTLAALCPLFASEKIPQSTIASFKPNSLFSAFSNEKENFDLYKLYTILVTVGWNLNDDVFGVEPVWNARHSPEDKPFNLEHNPRSVIGHITGCVVVDDAYSTIADETSFDKLPSKFHILTSAVLYKHIMSRDEKLAEETAELIASIARGEWFVSMEALFSNFDYALKSEADSKIIERTESTAFLTKHLRALGGLGEYKGYKVGRYLKDITFSGKGLVKRPGNPESYVFNDVSMFQGAFANLNEVFKKEIIFHKHVTAYTKLGDL
jgi:hypothetical protein